MLNVCFIRSYVKDRQGAEAEIEPVSFSNYYCLVECGWNFLRESKMARYSLLVRFCSDYESNLSGLPQGFSVKRKSERK